MMRMVSLILNVIYVLALWALFFLALYRIQRIKAFFQRALDRLL